MDYFDVEKMHAQRFDVGKKHAWRNLSGYVMNFSRLPRYAFLCLCCYAKRFERALVVEAISDSPYQLSQFHRNYVNFLVQLEFCIDDFFHYFHFDYFFIFSLLFYLCYVLSHVWTHGAVKIGRQAIRATPTTRKVIYVH